MTHSNGNIGLSMVIGSNPMVNKQTDSQKIIKITLQTIAFRMSYVLLAI